MLLVAYTRFASYIIAILMVVALCIALVIRIGSNSIWLFWSGYIIKYEEMVIYFCKEFEIKSQCLGAVEELGHLL